MMIRDARWLRLPAMALAATLLAGCGAGGPKLVPVDGTVTFDGEPLADAEVSFVPEPSNEAVTPGAGYTADDGTYRARYQGRFGLAPGQYKVTIRKLEMTPEVQADMPPEMLEDPAQLELMGVMNQTMPDAYANLDQTAFNITVDSGGGPYDFELDSQGR